ncbi:helix-turn-helix transcriptional regulator [Mycolicibacterium fortuitum]|uniref:helix-turn-helix transcriptional regulator n=1 Tax=Mycolicibacterium fortuitum TaxID=1766 RepID=UPI0007EBAA39|nr:helix-turn-helix domain-containing protein [Mycolicibacterium fortuitum]OBB38030.1 hypothetical protein A5763_29665 [Mycolicibacterium fortuitum]OBB44871.1 hypothetical protein A5754_10530 [Mycolicibacterium fortuitum]OBB70304.1 hypothetical protein A5755_16495 [Mycolicibacterium fortuitum]OBF84275.1 hypothetical protein A5751_11865 [Mycolicibacterium fortuitum]OBG13182.1 hypothetical protein A5768_09540 [Mycolicibacterium fortuitum]
MPAPTTPYLDYPGVAERLGLTIPTVRRLMKEEGLPAHRLSRRVKFLPDEVDAWLRARNVSGTPATYNVAGTDPDWVAAQVAKFSADDLRRAGELLLALANTARVSAGAA